MKRSLPLCLALLAATAGAEARLLSEADAPRVLLASAPRLLAPNVLGAAEVQAVSEGIGYVEHLVKTSAIGLASSATGVLLGAGLGALSNNLIAAAVPVLLANLFFPPIVTVLVAQVLGNWKTPGRFGFWLPLAGAFVVNAAAYVIASLALVVPWTNPLALLLYTLVDGVLMGGTTVGLMHLTQKKPQATTTLPSFVPGVSDTAMVSLWRVSL
jgi:hypothetical protein